MNVRWQKNYGYPIVREYFSLQINSETTVENREINELRNELWQRDIFFVLYVFYVIPVECMIRVYR